MHHILTAIVRQTTKNTSHQTLQHEHIQSVHVKRNTAAVTDMTDVIPVNYSGKSTEKFNEL